MAEQPTYLPQGVNYYAERGRGFRGMELCDDSVVIVDMHPCMLDVRASGTCKSLRMGSMGAV